MTDKMKIKEVIVVEGKDDTKRINLAVNADTLETRGSAISDETLAQIEELHDKRGVIVFTDPDFSGEKIRKIIQEAVPGVKHAFLTKKLLLQITREVLALNMLIQRRFGRLYVIYIQKSQMRRQ